MLGKGDISFVLDKQPQTSYDWIEIPTDNGLSPIIFTQTNVVAMSDSFGDKNTWVIIDDPINIDARKPVENLVICNISKLIDTILWNTYPENIIVISAYG